MKTEKLSTKVPARVFALNFLQLLGIGAAAVAFPSPEAATVLALLPDPVAGNIGKIAVGLIAAKPAVNMVGDWIDNGKLDRSWPLGLFMLFACLLFTSCGASLLPPTADRCFPVQRTLKSGAVIAAGPCVDDAGKIDRYYITWKNRDGIEFAARYIIATRQYVIIYQPTPGGPWLAYDSEKSGVSLDFPAGVSLDGKGSQGQIVPAG